MADDTLARMLRDHERAADELEPLLDSVFEAAMAEALAGLWQHVLGARTVIVAAGDRPSIEGLENTARRLWRATLDRWVKPVVIWSWAKQTPQARAEVIERVWDSLADRMQWTIDLVVDAVRKVMQTYGSDPADQLRDRVARVLSLDAAMSLFDDIAKVEAELLNPAQAATDRGAQFARRVRLQTNLFMLQASRARSKGFAVLARITPDDTQSRELRAMARSASRPAGDVRAAERELSRLDEKLFHNPELEPGRLAELHAKLVKLNGEGSHGHESWRNSVTRDARSVATGLLNASTLQYGVEQAAATGESWIKVWHATDDERVRPTHLEADKQVRPILEPFEVGDAKLDHPADFDAPPEEFYGCRCSMFVMSRAAYNTIRPQLALAAASTQEGEAMTVTEAETGELADLPPVMWHGVITLEDVYTGDFRRFKPGAIRSAALPLPIRFQREDWGGHTGAVTIANMEGMRRFGNHIRAWGTFADGTLTSEVDEVQGLMATRMIRGISIDGDDVLDSQFALELDDKGNGYSVFDSLRVRAATVVATPAYDGAEIYLGPPPAEWHLEGEPVDASQNEVGETTPINDLTDEQLEALLAASQVPENLAEYWTAGEGAAKIRWGTSGDFNRCREQLGKYASPGQVSGTCANLHHRALGVWPGQEAALLAGGGPLAIYESTTEDDWQFTREQFAPRELDALTPVTIDDDGTVYGHLAGWETCHTAYSDMCVTPPRSKTGYSLFHTGAVRLTDGTDLPIGKLTVGAGHADPNLGVRAATAHYDNSAVGVAIVQVHEDKWGLQASGVIIPGTPREKVEELRRSPISGDWRGYRGNLELIAGLGVNSPGFPVPRTMVASAAGHQLSLVAAGYVEADVSELFARIAPTQDEIDARVAKLAARVIPNKTEA